MLTDCNKKSFGVYFYTMKHILIWGVVIVIIVAGIFTVGMAHRWRTEVVIDPPADPGRVRSPEEKVLKVGETTDIAGLQVSFDKFSQDSRCSGENCPEYGAVALTVTLSTGDVTEVKHMASDEVPYEFEGYAISIIAINPPRPTDRELREDEYEITFRVAPLAGMNVQENPGI
jgi:hypothetical protein